MSDNQKIENWQKAKVLSKWFQVEFTLSIFGKVILHYVWPPKSQDDVD